MSEYYIGMDSYGKPYIAHWGTRKNHKYVARISDGKGGYRYFYTQAQWEAYQKQESKKRAKQEDRENNYNKVSAKQYLTGGKEKQSFKYAKKENRKAQSELKSSTRAYHQSVKKQQKANAALKNAKENGAPWDVRKAERAVSDAKKETSQASQRASAARVSAKKAENKYKAHERVYESTSLPGQTHKFVRVGTANVRKLSQTVGNTPVAYVKKSR